MIHIFSQVPTEQSSRQMHISGNKTILTKFLKLKSYRVCSLTIVESKEIINRNLTRKSINSWKLNSILLNNPYGKEKLSKDNFKNYTKTHRTEWKWKYNISEYVQHNWRSEESKSVKWYFLTSKEKPDWASVRGRGKANILNMPELSIMFNTAFPQEKLF